MADILEERSNYSIGTDIDILRFVSTVYNTKYEDIEKTFTSSEEKLRYNFYFFVINNYAIEKVVNDGIILIFPDPTDKKLYNIYIHNKKNNQSRLDITTTFENLPLKISQSASNFIKNLNNVQPYSYKQLKALIYDYGITPKFDNYNIKDVNFLIKEFAKVLGSRIYASLKN